MSPARHPCYSGRHDPLCRYCTTGHAPPAMSRHRFQPQAAPFFRPRTRNRRPQPLQCTVGSKPSEARRVHRTRSCGTCSGGSRGSRMGREESCRSPLVASQNRLSVSGARGLASGPSAGAGGPAPPRSGAAAARNRQGAPNVPARALFARVQRPALSTAIARRPCSGASTPQRTRLPPVCGCPGKCAANAPALTVSHPRSCWRPQRVTPNRSG